MVWLIREKMFCYAVFDIFYTFVLIKPLANMKMRKLLAALVLAAATLPVAALVPVRTQFKIVSDDRIMLNNDYDGDDVSIAGAPLRNVRVQVSLVEPTELGGHDVYELRQALEKAAGVHFTDAGTLLVDSWKSLEPAPTSVAKADYGQWLTVESSVVCLDSRLAVWRIDHEMYCGGAHGMYSTDFVNCSVADGKVLSFGDIFRGNAKPALRKAIVEWLSQSEYASDVTLYGDINSIDVPEVFYFEGHSRIWFVFQPYEIAPFSSGTIFVPLQIWSISETLTPYGKNLLRLVEE